MPSGVELRDLRVFFAVAEELHFGRAAERLQLNRSRVSQIVKTLELRLGADLFERTSRRVWLTPTGEQLRVDTQPLYQQLQLALQRARSAPATDTKVLRIGIYTPICMGRHVADIVRWFQSRCPETEIAFINASSGLQYLDWLTAGAVDMLAARLPLNRPDLTIGPVLSREQRILLVARHDILAARDSVTTQDYADRAVADVADVPRELTDAFSAVMRVAAGSEVYATVRRVFEHHGHPDIVGIPIADLEPFETALVWSSTNDSPPLDAFVTAAATVLEQTSSDPHRHPDNTSPRQPPASPQSRPPIDATLSPPETLRAAAGNLQRG